jgi:hypothetical protein
VQLQILGVFTMKSSSNQNQSFCSDKTGLYLMPYVGVEEIMRVVEKQH